MKKFKTPNAIPDFLEALQKNISSNKIQTTYSHVTKITPQTIETDCSGFVSHVLSETGHQHLVQEILDYKKQNQKSAQDWSKVFVRNFTCFLENATSIHWKILPESNLLSKGDIIFSTNFPTPNNGTNHCVFVMGVTQISKNKYELVVMDSTESLIHFDDTRTVPGIGSGKIIIEKDLNDVYWKCNFSPNLPVLRKKLLFARVL